MITFAGISQRYGDRDLFSDLTLDLRGSTALMGPSGSGKSTLLRYVAGFQAPTAGSVHFHKPTRLTQALGPKVPVPMVFQHPTTFPWLSARDNVRFVLNPGEDADTYLAAVGILDTADRYAKTPFLSGGQLRRLEVARAIASLHTTGGPPVLLMDEPFTGLDITSRKLTMSIVEGACRQSQITLVLATHDPREAVSLTRRTVVLGHYGTGISAIIDNTTASAESDILAHL